MRTKNLAAVLGDNNDYDVSISKNLAGASIVLIVKVDRDDVLDVLSKVGVVTDAVNGKATILLIPADLAGFTRDVNLVYDVKLIEADGHITTIQTGSFLIVETAAQGVI